MPSRLLSDLQARIAAATRDPVLNACLRAERATVLARQGRLDEARAELDLIRTRHAAKPNAVVTAWVCLGEGMVILYSDLAASSRDKVLRAHALAAASGSRRVRSLSAAWLAHFSYVAQDFASMVKYLDEVLSTTPDTEDATLERACLVIAQAYHWSDRFDLARPWYERARWHAVNVGDETFVSALMHNMAWLHVAQERRRALLAQINHEWTSQILLGAEATESFDVRIGTASLKSLVPILRAHVLSLLDRHREAVELYDVHLGDALEQGLSRIECSVLAELAWCQANCGEKTASLASAKLAQDKLGSCAQNDERGATHGRLAQCFRMLGDHESAAFHASRSKLEWDKHFSIQQSALSVLASSKLIATNADSPGADR